ncbi:hypothetical protein QLQ85_20395 [Halomonas sp. M4R5S39]|uniref:hypothetical protein n=1 Tax=Halomonas kalidii TaxID=3043293 RepID=UPI0024A851EB|nr:hypothetical protein [Halomonas kalidii]MDI5987150.1 hypothetical protein [Halomonas kalidii]
MSPLRQSRRNRPLALGVYSFRLTATSPKVDGPVGIEEVLGPDTLRLLKDRNLYLSASICQLPGPATPREATLPN